MTDIHTTEIAGQPIRKTFPIANKSRIVFGRSSQCVGQLQEDERISRRHFCIEAQFPEVKLRDLGSLHGTKLQRNATSEAQVFGGKHRKGKKKAMSVGYLINNSIIHAGQTVFEISLSPCCFLCTQNIANEQASICELRPGILICPNCLQQQNQKFYSNQIQRLKACPLCGQNTGHEIPNAGSGTYICRSCRKQAYRDINILANLFKQTEDVREDYPSVITDYELIKLLGIGSMGASYLARCHDNSKVVIKILLPKIAARPIVKHRFLEKIAQCRTMKHPNLVSYSDFGYAASGFYVAQEYCRGSSIAKVFAHSAGQISAKQAIPFILQALEGLDYLHSHGIFHRDLKPQNLLLTENSVVKITDWIISSEFELLGLANHTMTGMIVDIPGYMPREQLIHFDQMNAQSDIWSMAAILYFILTNHFPRNFPEERHPLGVVLDDEITPITTYNPKITDILATVIHRALDEDYKKRYPNAMAFHQALSQAMNGGS